MKKVVLVDDYAGILEVQKEFIEMNNDVTCVIFSKPLEALQYIEDQKDVDILITDYEMPRMNGFELAEKVLAKFPDMRIIISSGHDEATLKAVSIIYELQDKLELKTKGNMDFFANLV